MPGWLADLVCLLGVPCRGSGIWRGTIHCCVWRFNFVTLGVF